MKAGMSERRSIVGIVAILLGLVAVGIYMAYTDALIVRPPDYCPEGTWAQEWQDIRSPGHTAILIDTSNLIDAEDGENAIEEIATWTRDIAPFLQRLSAYGLPDSLANEVEPFSESFCVPKEGREADIVYENPIFVEAEFRRFLSRLEAILRILIGLDEAGQSPIIEAMVDLTEKNDDLDSFVLVSDMLQHTQAWSHYGQQGNTEEADSICDRITGPGKVKAVYVYYIDRDRDDVQSPTWPDEWWRNCLGDIEMQMLNPMTDE